jgi:hypothetical protein
LKTLDRPDPHAQHTRARRKKFATCFGASARISLKSEGKQTSTKAVADQPQINADQRQVIPGQCQIDAK